MSQNGLMMIFFTTLFILIISITTVSLRRGRGGAHQWGPLPALPQTAPRAFSTNFITNHTLTLATRPLLRKRPVLLPGLHASVFCGAASQATNTSDVMIGTACPKLRDASHTTKEFTRNRGDSARHIE